jgi:hypothetical protein
MMNHASARSRRIAGTTARVPRVDRPRSAPPAGEPGQVAVTVIACLVLLLVFIVIAALV